jgi:hypothetical protein
VAKKGPKSQEAIAKVTRNLPTPENSGPRTEEGKRIVGLNPVKHGLTMPGFLPCKKEKCYYFEVCELSKSEEGLAALKELEYGTPCPQEIVIYLNTKKALEKVLGDKSETLPALWAMNEVRMSRRQKYSSVEVSLIRELPFKGTIFSSPALSLALRYHYNLVAERDRLFNLYCKTMDNTSSMVK